MRKFHAERNSGYSRQGFLFSKPTLRRTFATTNAIENMNGSLRRIARYVKRWKDRR
jgi:hypothetical protein